MFYTGDKKKMAALSEILEPRIVERFLIEENNSYEDLVKEIKNQFPGVRGCSLQSARNQEASVSVRQYPRSCRAKCYFRGRGNVFVVDLKLHVISILFTTVDYTVYLMYCPTSGAKCKRLNI